MPNDYKDLRAGMTATRSEPVMGLLAFAFGLILVGVVVGLIWAVFEVPKQHSVPVIADADVVQPVEPLVEEAPPVAEVQVELAGGARGEDVGSEVALPTGETRDANLRQYIDTVDQLESCALKVGTLNLRDLRKTYEANNREAYEAWMNARVAAKSIIRRDAPPATDPSDESFSDMVGALRLQARAEDVQTSPSDDELSPTRCAQIKIEVQAGERDVAPPPSA
ncbi:MAG: hypothetical protein AAF216_09035 [Pseudomonadota bacterium]